MMDKHIIYCLHITDRLKHVSQVQTILTEYGCNIKTRLGLHETSPDACSPNGLLIMEMVGDDNVCQQMLDKLNQVEGVEAKSIVFDHP